MPRFNLPMLSWSVGVAASLGCAAPQVAARDAPTAPGRMHTVAAGETVWDLSRRSGLTVEEIVEVNGLRSADEISDGQVIYLPAGGEPAVDAPTTAEREEPAVAAGPEGSRLVWPVDGVVLRSFASGKRSFDGLLIAAPSGTAVRAAAPGQVAFVGDQGTTLGLLVVVRHPDGVTSIYGHLERAGVALGEAVAQGQVLGVVGTSGGAESPRLHFQLRRGRTPVDPTPLLPPE